MKTIQGDGIDLGLASRQFTMKTSAKAFSILSSGLYSNKIRAVIRELSCNAHDSHVEAGTQDLPFDVQLPSYSNPQFFVRDYGTGLTEEEIYNVYTTYFESTKTDSNEYTGALGLGSKSPFCISDSFTIETFKDHLHKTFIAFIGKSGMPELSKLSEVETSAPNGVKVTVDVHENYYKWSDEAEDLYMWFPTQPNVISEDGFTTKKIDKISKLTDKVAVISSSSTGYDTKMIIVQGTVAYGVSSRDILNHFPTFEFLTEMHLMVEVPIGTVDITASRESISFIDVTVGNLSRVFETIKVKVLEKIEEEFQNCNNNPWSMLETQNRIKNHYPLDLVKESPTLINHPNYEGGDFVFTDMPYLNKKQGTVTVKEYTTNRGKISTVHYEKRNFMERLHTRRMYRNTHVIINNDGRGMLPTMRLYSAKNPTADKIIAIGFVNKKAYSRRVVNNILKAMMDPLTVMFSKDLPRPTVKSSGTKSKPSFLSVKTLQGHNNRWVNEAYANINMDNAYFVELDNHTIITNKYFGNINDLFLQIRKVLPEAFFDRNKICGLTKSQAKNFAKAGIKTKSLFDAVESHIDNLDLSESLKHSCVTSNIPSFLSNTYFKEIIEMGRCIVPEINTLVNIRSMQRKDLVSVMDVKTTISRLHLNIDCEQYDIMERQAAEDSKALVDFIADIYKVAPMAKYFGHGYSNANQAHGALVDYLNDQYNK